TIVDLYPAISLALGLLDDHHSFYQAAAGGGLGNPQFPRCAAVTPLPPSLPADIGYVKVIAFGDATPGADRAFADSCDADRRRGRRPSRGPCRRARARPAFVRSISWRARTRPALTGCAAAGALPA